MNPSSAQATPAGSRTVGELRNAAEKIGEDRQRVASQRAAMEKLRRERDAAEERASYLAALVEREPAAWREIDDLIASTQPKGYDRAVELLADLRDAAVSHGSEAEFARRLEALQSAYSRRPSLISRLRRAGFPPRSGELAMY